MLNEKGKPQDRESNDEEGAEQFERAMSKFDGDNRPEEVSDLDLPGMWEQADFLGGPEDTEQSEVCCNDFHCPCGN